MLPSTSPWPTRWLILVLCLALCATAMAQSTGGRILGRVADSTGAVLAGVKVTLINEATGVATDTQTNPAGDYGFPQVAVGSYRLEFDQKGFKKSIQRGIALDLNQVLTINAILQIGATQETVEVTSEAPLVDTTSTQLGAVMDQRSVSNLPLNARDTYQLLQLQPGVQGVGGADLFYGSNQAGAVSVNGGRGRANNFNVNGGDGNDYSLTRQPFSPRPIAFRNSEFYPIRSMLSTDGILALLSTWSQSLEPTAGMEVHMSSCETRISMPSAILICAGPTTIRTSLGEPLAVRSTKTAPSFSRRTKDGGSCMG